MAKYELTKEVTVDEFVGSKIRDLRQAKGMEQEEFGKLLDLGRSSVSNIELGRQKLILKHLERVCEVLKCKSSDILPF